MIGRSDGRMVGRSDSWRVGRSDGQAVGGWDDVTEGQKVRRQSVKQANSRSITQCGSNMSFWLIGPLRQYSRYIAMEPSTTFTDYTAVADNAAATSTVADNTANTSDTSAAADNTADTSEVAGNTPDTSAVADKHCFVARSLVLQPWLKGWWFAEHRIHAKDLKPETLLEMETLWFSGARKLASVSAPDHERIMKHEPPLWLTAKIYEAAMTCDEEQLRVLVRNFSADVHGGEGGAHHSDEPWSHGQPSTTAGTLTAVAGNLEIFDLAYFQNFRDFTSGYKQHCLALKWFRDSSERSGLNRVIFSNTAVAEAPRSWRWQDMVAQLDDDSICILVEGLPPRRSRGFIQCRAEPHSESNVWHFVLVRNDWSTVYLRPSDSDTQVFCRFWHGGLSGPGDYADITLHFDPTKHYRYRSMD